MPDLITIILLLRIEIAIERIDLAVKKAKAILKKEEKENARSYYC
jgi:hypothetical protein